MCWSGETVVYEVFWLCLRAQKYYTTPATSPALLNSLQPQHQNPRAASLASLHAAINPHKNLSGGYFRFSYFTYIWPILDFVRLYLVNLKM